MKGMAWRPRSAPTQRQKKLYQPDFAPCSEEVRRAMSELKPVPALLMTRPFPVKNPHDVLGKQVCKPRTAHRRNLRNPKLVSAPAEARPELQRPGPESARKLRLSAAQCTGDDDQSLQKVGLGHCDRKLCSQSLRAHFACPSRCARTSPRPCSMSFHLGTESQR